MSKHEHDGSSGSADATEAVTTEAVAIGPEIQEGVRVGFRRFSDGTVEESAFTPAKEGAAVPPGAELVYLGDREAGAPWRSVRASYKAAGDGPAQVATPRYRENFDRIFGKRAVVGQA